MEIFGFIPARGDSKGIPKKNIHPIDGKPMIAYTIEEAKKSKINRILVSTDSEDIAKVSRKYGADVPFLRSKALAMDNSIIEDALIEALEILYKSEKYQPYAIVLLHPTTPLRTFHHIDDCIDILINKKVDSVISVSEPLQHPGDMVWWNQTGQMCFLLEKLLHTGSIPGKMQRQSFPGYWFINGAVYSFTYKALIKTGNRYGEKNLPYKMSQIDSIDIDSMDSLMIVESLLQRRKNRNN